MIVTNVTLNAFHDAFNAMRPNQFSYDALTAMFDYFEELSEDIGEPLELDVIAICCDWVEFGSMADAVYEYWDIGTRDLRDHTTVLELRNGNGGVVIQQF